MISEHNNSKCYSDMWSLRAKADLTLIFSVSQSTERSGLVISSKLSILPRKLLPSDETKSSLIALCVPSTRDSGAWPYKISSNFSITLLDWLMRPAIVIFAYASWWRYVVLPSTTEVSISEMFLLDKYRSMLNTFAPNNNECSAECPPMPRSSRNAAALNFLEKDFADFYQY